MRKAIYRRVAEIHAESIASGFLTSLGTDFLALLYQAIDEAPDSVLMLAWEGDEVVSFVAGTQGMGKIYRQMFQHWAKLSRTVLPVLFSFRRIRRVFDILLYSRGGVGSGHILPRAELLSIATARGFRGKGHAEMLYRQLSMHYRKIGTPAFRIVVGNSLASAHRFYQRMGAKPVTEIQLHSGETSTVYVQTVE